MLAHDWKASGGILPRAFASLKFTPALSKSQLFCSRHCTDHSMVIPDICEKEVARDLFVASSRAEVVAGAGTGSLFRNGFLLDKSVAGVTNNVSLMMQKPAFWGTTMKHLEKSNAIINKET